MSPVMKMFQNIPHYILWGILIVLLVANGVVGSLFIQGNSITDHTEFSSNVSSASGTPSLSPAMSRERIEIVKKEEKFEVVVKENLEDKRKSDIYLKDKDTKEEAFFITLEDVYRNHYHKAEYHNGNVYILVRPGGENYYLQDPNWTTELWRYDQQKNGKKLYSNKGIDFRVSDDEQIIAIDATEKFEILDKNGVNLISIKMSELKTTDKMPEVGFLRFIEFGREDIWLSTEYGPSLIGLVNINLNSGVIEKYDLTDLDTGQEYAFNIERELLAFTNYPPIFDEGGYQSLVEEQKRINLSVFNLETKEQKTIVSTIASGFMPVWLDENTLEYNDPNGEGKLKYVVTP